MHFYSSIVLSFRLRFELFSFWAANLKGTMSSRTRSNVRPFIHPSVRRSVSPYICLAVQPPSPKDWRVSEDLKGPQIASETPQGASGRLRSLRRPQRASKCFRLPMSASGRLSRSKRRPLEGPEGLGRPERTSRRLCRGSQGKTDGRKNVRILPFVSYRTSAPSSPLPCIYLSMKKRQHRASNDQQYPLSCCAHFRFPKCVQQGKGYH